MAANLTDLKVNARSIDAILRGEEGNVRRDLDARAARVARRAGSGYVAEGWVGRRRYRATVHSTKPTKISGSPLVAALDAGR